mmetsp:Transcript_5191/g.13335  ORF Transcript_5191/g.13335 Transcript_5191/m.13335 type:complete len:111 (+) Transcript_5191:52-384(+)
MADGASAKGSNAGVDKEQVLMRGAEELQQIRSRMVQLEAQEREHESALETLGTLPADRRAFRLVGDVLVEQTVGDALESVKANREMINETMSNCVKQIREIEAEVKKLAN